MSDCCCGDAESGYEALKVWRRVQVWRPRESTAGGQSGLGEVMAEAAVMGGV